MASVLISAMVILLALLAIGPQMLLKILIVMVIIINISIITITVFLCGKDRNYRHLNEVVAEGKLIFITNSIENELSNCICYGYKDDKEAGPHFFEKILEITSGVFASDFQETSSLEQEEVEK